MNRSHFTCLLLVCLIFFGGTLGCRGYHLGNQFLFRSDIRTIHVATFESNSYRRFLGQRMTEAVIRQIATSTPLTITEPALANSFLTGRIVRDRKTVVGENISDEPRSLDVDWRLEVEWTDRAGVPLMQRQSLRLDRGVTFIPEGGQSISTAQQQLIERLARDIVGQMELPW
jgi:hypothetical protein